MAEAAIKADFSKWRTFLLGMSKRGDDLRSDKSTVRKIYSPIIMEDVVKHFENEEGPDGPWQNWSRSYERHMDAIGKGGNKILQDTGRLRQNIKPGNVTGGNFKWVWFNNAHTKDGFPYAKAHDEGGGRLPKREFMWVSDKAMDLIAQATLDYLVRKR